MNKRQIKKKISRIIREPEREAYPHPKIKRQLRKNLSHIICEAESQAFDSMIDGDVDDVKYSDGTRVYKDGYGEVSFPIRLSSKRQVEEIRDYLNWVGYDGWDFSEYEEILDQLNHEKVKATYKLWVAFTASPTLGNFPYWGLERVTESPDRR